MKSARELVVKGEVFEWRGPAPFHFVALSAEHAAEIKDMASLVTYGWGMIPVAGQLGNTRFETSLWPKNGTYYVPLKDVVRNAERVELGDTVKIALTVRMAKGRR